MLIAWIDQHLAGLLREAVPPVDGERGASCTCVVGGYVVHAYDWPAANGQRVIAGKYCHRLRRNRAEDRVVWPLDCLQGRACRAVAMISVGPFPLMALVALLALGLGWAFARALTPAADGLRSRAGAVVLDAFLLGLLGARLAHVVLHAGDYLAQPLSIIRLGDGGYSIWAGLLVAAGYALWKTRKR